MTSTRTSADTALDLGHPVRSFVLVLLAATLVLLALDLSGAVHPAVDSSGRGTHDLGDLRIRSVEVHNDGLLPVEVQEVSWPTTRMRSVTIGLAPDGYFRDPDLGLDLIDIPPVEPFTLDPEESRWLFLSFVPDCPATFGDVTLEVRTPLRLERGIVLKGTGEVVDSC